jgi:4-amino-4-deoxy-L-arabinose transferase-like glycosyltransferase
MNRLNIPRAVWIGAALFLALRAAIILIWGSSVPPDVTDHEVYHKNAILLLSGWEQWVRPGSEFGYRAPLFFVYLAAAHALTGSDSFIVSQLASALVGTAACIVAFVLARSLAGERAGYFAFALRGLLPNYVISDTYVMSEQMFGLLLLSLLAVVAAAGSRPQFRHAVVLGLLLGIAMLVREAGLVYPAIFLTYLALTQGSLRLRAARVALCGAVIVAVLTPWLIRNHSVWGHALPLGYTAGPGLHSGNNPGFEGAWKWPPSPPDTIRFGTPEFEQWHRDQAMEYIKQDPAAFVQRGFVKVAWLLFPRFHRYDMKIVYPSMEGLIQPLSAVIGLTAAGMLLVGVFAFTALRTDSFWWVCLGLIGIIVAAIVATGGDPRYRDPIDYILLIATGVLLGASGTVKEKLLAVRAQPMPKLVLMAACYAAIAASWIWVAIDKST